MRFFQLSSILTISVALLCLCLTACGPGELSGSTSDENNNTNNSTINNTSQNSHANNNSSDNSGQPDEPDDNNSDTPPGPPPTPSQPQPCGGQCATDELCIRGKCVLDTCDGAENLGELLSTQSLTVRGTNTESEDLLRVTCASGQQHDARELVYTFRVSAPALMTLNLSPRDNTTWAFELRKGDCYDSSVLDSSDDELPTSSQIACFRQANIEHTVELEPNHDYYLIVQPQVTGMGWFDLTMQMTPLSCEPGERSCNLSNDDAVDICDDRGVDASTRECGTSCEPYGCNGLDCCKGDSCEIPITIDFEDTQEVYLFAGHSKAHTNAINFQEMTFLPTSTGSCSGGNIGTEGSDLYFLVENVRQNDTISIDIQNRDSNNNDIPAERNLNAVYILDDCPDMETKTANCFSYTKDNGIFNWRAPRHGSFVIVIDKRVVLQDNYIYRICKGICPPYSP